MLEAPPLLLLTDRPALRLRLLGEDDADTLFALVDDNRAWLRTWLPWIDRTTRAAHSLEYVRWMRDQHARGLGFSCGLWFEGRLVGSAGPHVVDLANRACQIGYWLDETHTGRGLMTSAVRALVDHAFAKMDLARVEIRAAPGNHASQAVAERLGFVREGVLRDAEWLYDHFVDLSVNSLLRREWQALHQADSTAAPLSP